MSVKTQWPAKWMYVESETQWEWPAKWTCPLTHAGEINICYTHNDLWLCEMNTSWKTVTCIMNVYWNVRLNVCYQNVKLTSVDMTCQINIRWKTMTCHIKVCWNTMTSEMNSSWNTICTDPSQKEVKKWDECLLKVVKHTMANLWSTPLPERQ